MIAAAVESPMLIHVSKSVLPMYKACSNDHWIKTLSGTNALSGCGVWRLLLRGDVSCKLRTSVLLVGGILDENDDDGANEADDEGDVDDECEADGGGDVGTKDGDGDGVEYE